MAAKPLTPDTKKEFDETVGRELKYAEKVKRSLLGSKTAVSARKTDNDTPDEDDGDNESDMGKKSWRTASVYGEYPDGTPDEDDGDNKSDMGKKSWCTGSVYGEYPDLTQRTDNSQPPSFFPYTDQTPICFWPSTAIPQPEHLTRPPGNLHGAWYLPRQFPNGPPKRKCKWISQGLASSYSAKKGCRAGADCHFAHSEEELHRDAKKGDFSRVSTKPDTKHRACPQCHTKLEPVEPAEGEEVKCAGRGCGVNSRTRQDLTKQWRYQCHTCSSKPDAQTKAFCGNCYKRWLPQYSNPQEADTQVLGMDGNRKEMHPSGGGSPAPPPGIVQPEVDKARQVPQPEVSRATSSGSGEPHADIEVAAAAAATEQELTEVEIGASELTEGQAAVVAVEFKSDSPGHMLPSQRLIADAENGALSMESGVKDPEETGSRQQEDTPPIPCCACCAARPAVQDWVQAMQRIAELEDASSLKKQEASELKARLRRMDVATLVVIQAYTSYGSKRLSTELLETL